MQTTSGADFGTPLSQILRRESTFFVVALSSDVICELEAALRELDVDQRPTVRLLASKSALTTIRNQFFNASRLAEFVEDDTVEIRQQDGLTNQYVVGAETYFSVVSLESKTIGVEAADYSVAAAVQSAAESLWEDGTSFNLRTPPLKVVEQTLTDTFGMEVATDFRHFVDRGVEMPTPSPDATTLALLTAARHRLLLYDICKWGEDTRLASKSTFSGTKKQLEKESILETEAVPGDIGRPRLRLKLPQELRDCDAAELLAIVAADQGREPTVSVAA